MLFYSIIERKTNRRVENVLYCDISCFSFLLLQHEIHLYDCMSIVAKSYSFPAFAIGDDRVLRNTMREDARNERDAGVT